MLTPELTEHGLETRSNAFSAAAHPCRALEEWHPPNFYLT